MKKLLLSITFLSNFLIAFSAQSSIIASDLTTGVHGQEQVHEFTFSGLSNHNTVSINYDLMMWDSWDGDHWYWGSDIFGMRVDGNTIFEYTFSNFNSAGDSNPYAVTQTGQLGRSGWNDYFYENYASGFNLSHSSSDLSIEFYSSGLQSLNDESWEVTNLDISAVPEPSIIALFALGLAGIGFTKRQRAAK